MRFAFPLLMSTAFAVGCGKEEVKSPTVRHGGGDASHEIGHEREADEDLVARPGEAGEKPETDDAEKAPGTAGPILVLVAGGRGSCGAFTQVEQNYMNPHLVAQLASAKEAVADSSRGITDVEYALSCFGKESSQVGYMTSKNPTKLTLVPVDEYLKLISAWSRELGKPRVFITGHSWGGWLSLKLADALKQGTYGMRLNTLDAISGTTCGVRNFITWGIGRVFDRDLSQDNPGCNSAPTDFSSDTLTEIRNAFPHWRNAYQSQLPPLHSSAIDQAETNEDHSYPALDAHGSLAVDKELLQLLASEVLADLKP